MVAPSKDLSGSRDLDLALYEMDCGADSAQKVEQRAENIKGKAADGLNQSTRPVVRVFRKRSWANPMYVLFAYFDAHIDLDLGF